MPFFLCSFHQGSTIWTHSFNYWYWCWGAYSRWRRLKWKGISGVIMYLCMCKLCSVWLCRDQLDNNLEFWIKFPHATDTKVKFPTPTRPYLSKFPTHLAQKVVRCPRFARRGVGGYLKFRFDLCITILAKNIENKKVKNRKSTYLQICLIW